jgi:hypothetical protein
LYILQKHFVSRFFQPSCQVEEPEGHSEAFAYGIGWVNQENAHEFFLTFFSIIYVLFQIVNEGRVKGITDCGMPNADLGRRNKSG